MSGLSNADLSALALDLYRSCRDLPVNQYQHWAVDRLKSVIQFDAGKWVSAHMTKQAPVIHNVTLFNRPPSMHEDYERVKQHDFVAYDVVAHSGTARLYNAIRSKPGLAPGFVAYLAKWDTIHAMSCAIVDPLTDLLAGIGIWREAPEHPFTEGERRFLGAAMPHLVETHAINRISHLLRATQPRNAATYASAVADPLAQLRIAPKNFQAMLLREWPDWRGCRLPVEMRHLADRSGSRYVGSKVFFRSSCVDNLVLLQAREKRPADELTVRQREIAQLAASGLSYNQVADRLTISPATVRTHLSSVYKKLKARKQAELVSKLRDAE